MSVLEVELVQLWGQLLVLVQKEAGKELRDGVAMLLRKLINDLLKDSQVRTVGALDEAVKKHDHFVELESVLSHDSH